MNYGRLINGVVVDIATDPNKQFHPILAAEFVEIPDHVASGWTFDGTEYEPPVVADPVAAEVVPVKVTMSPVDFKLLFTASERIAIAGIREIDPVLDDFYSLLDDPRLTVIDLSKPSIVEGVTYAVNKLVEGDVVTDAEQRISEILGGGNANA